MNKATGTRQEKGAIPKINFLSIYARASDRSANLFKALQLESA